MTEEEIKEFIILTYKLDDGLGNSDIDMICDWISAKKKLWEQEVLKKTTRFGYDLGINDLTLVGTIFEDNSKLVEKTFEK